ncbi:MAG TPA: pyridoxal-phosphate dependent enzyme, partial [Candidatus Polarisedimenticolaceae bacterium]|nr:pyridoxal-phosphate dependent enzyme [Candidatus Polarisedimenticolaceae bacterium]
MNRVLQVFDDILQTLPGIENPTPLVRLNRTGTTGAFPLWAKLEWFNPFGSVKDRAASYMIRELEKQGVLSDKRGVVEPTSGN